jgi:apolipoprotein N-acyltransferase
MDDAISLSAPVRVRRLAALRSGVRELAPTRVELGLSLSSAALLILSFPDFNLWPLAWVGLIPLLFAVARNPQHQARAFLLGWLTGTLYFYGSCYWLTHAMIRYGGFPSWIAYPLLFMGALVVGLFPGIFSFALARLVSRWGRRALLIAPLLWVALEWARLGVTGQLWNAIGYSQAYVPELIQTASWGGVYAVSFLILIVNTAITYILLSKSIRASVMGSVSIILVVFVALWSELMSPAQSETPRTEAVVVAIQPNVPMDPVSSVAESQALFQRHLEMSERALRDWEAGLLYVDGKARQDQSQQDKLKQERSNVPRLVIWPESPMYFAYARDTQFREDVARFAAENRTSVLFNSQEPAPANGSYNAAVMINEEGRLVAQYDKIRLLPFGEYVPLPRWLPGVNLIPVLVGDFTPGTDYPLMPVGSTSEARAGVFICFESAFPVIAREFSERGADVLVNISNDGYLGRTPVMRQHLANAVFRAVENNRPILRVTNTGITAYINPRGEVSGATAGFQTDVRTWTVSRATNGKTFYTKRGDLFVGLCAALSLVAFATTFKKSGVKTA